MRITLRGFSCAVLLAGMLCSCQKELAQVEQPETEINMVAAEFSAVTEAGMPTRMTLGEGLKPAWEAWDKLAVWDGSLVTAFSVKKAEGSFAKFDGQVAEGSDGYYALFPHTEGIAFDAEAKAFKTVIPSEQIISQGDSVCASALMGMAYAPKPAEGQAQFAFRNVCGLIKVDVPESGKIASIVISSNGEETFVGEGTVSLQEKTEGQLTQTIPVFTPAVGAGKTVTLRPEGENATFEKGSYYAVVAPVEFQTGFSINMVRTDGAAGKISTDQPMKVVRNGGANLKDIVAVSEWSLEIWTKEQLFAWGRNWGRLDKVTLMADIDMEGDPWTPVGNGANWFSGVFDGNGKRIYNLNVNTDGYAGFIGHLAGEGCVRDLTIGSKDGTNYDGKSAIVHTPSKDEYGWNYVGAIAKAGDHAVVEGVTNFAKVVIPESEFKVKACMGGVVGFHAGSGEINTCVNRAELNFLAADGPAVSNVIGGIVSKLDGVTKVSNCDNYGKITNKNAKVFYIGGIVGNTRSNNYKNDKPSTIQTCKNEGAIEVLAASADSCGIGGICGMLQNADLATCTNTGKITLSTSSATNIYIGGIAGMRRNSYDTSITACVNGVENISSSLIEYNTTEGDVKFGGILGHCHKSSGKLTITGCTNHSPIYLSNVGGIFQVGGISGAIVENVKLMVSECVNNGAMNFTSSSTTGQKYFGGMFGFLRSVEDADFSISGCTNNGNIATSAGGTKAETDIAGIVGYAASHLTFTACKNYGTISTSGAATKPRPAGVAGVANGTGTKFISCENWGEVSSASSHSNLYIGGLIAFSESISLDGCSNNAEVKVTNAGGEVKLGGITGQAKNVTIENSYNKNKVSFAANKQPRIGGIVGNIISDVTISNCHNQSNGVVECLVVGGTACVGGVAGRIGGDSTTSQNIIIEDSSNSGAVTVKSTGNSLLVGGIVAVIEHGNTTGVQNSIERCFNNGGITASSTSTGSNQYVRAGGIVGQCSDITNTVISDCENKEGGVVAITGTTTPSGTHAAGIVGYTRVCVGLSNNTNRAQISANGSNSGVYVGGIWAYDDTMASGHTAKDIAGNVNYGEVSGTCGSGKTLCVGGLFGIVRKVAVANLKSDNTNYGNVTCAGGALAGRSDIATWQGKVGKNVLVNGILWDNWAEGEEAKWLCPVATNPVTANYVDAPAN